MEKVYIQTYSIRNDTAKDFAGSLKKLGEMGYAGVEFAGGYGGNNAKDFKALLDDCGLEFLGAHVGIGDADEQLDFLTEVGGKYIVCPGAPCGTKEEVAKLIDDLNRLGKKYQAAGMKYGYHNHTGEFALIDDKYILSHLIENTDPDNVIFELDVGWATTAGIDAIEYINKYAGRFKLIHAKETDSVLGTGPAFDRSKIKLDENGRPIFTDEMKQAMLKRQMIDVPSGKGIVDWPKVKAVADAQGAVAYVVEREYDYKGDDMFGCVREDLEYFKTI